MLQNVLTTEQLREKAPSIFSTLPSEKMSEKYVMVPTIDIIKGFEEFGYYPTFAKQSKTRKGAVSPYAVHNVRFRHKSFLNLSLKDVAPEISVFNSHNGRLSAQALAGLYRLVCSNGLTIAENIFGGINQRHAGMQVGDIEELIFNFAKSSDKIMTQVDTYKSIKLNQTEKEQFANEAKIGIYGDTSKINSSTLLTPRREDDFQNDLFTVFNVVQENVIKGGIEFQGEKRRSKTKGIKSVVKDTKVNILLWGLMDQVAKSK